MTGTFKDYYSILGIAFSASESDIKKGYRKMALQFHPDRNPEDPEAFTAAFREVTEAYETLSDPGKKEAYDQQYRWQVLGETPYYKEPYYKETEADRDFYYSYEPLVQQRRKPLVPYAAFALMGIFFIRMLFNNTWPEPGTGHAYQPMQPPPPAVAAPFGHAPDSSAIPVNNEPHRPIAPWQ